MISEYLVETLRSQVAELELSLIGVMKITDILTTDRDNLADEVEQLRAECSALDICCTGLTEDLLVEREANA